MKSRSHALRVQPIRKTPAILTPALLPACPSVAANPSPKHPTIRARNWLGLIEKLANQKNLGSRAPD